MNPYHLGDRELEALELLAWEGLQYNEIAQRMGISRQSVCSKFSCILGKMNVETAIQAVLKYHGLLTKNPGDLA